MPDGIKGSTNKQNGPECFVNNLLSMMQALVEAEIRTCYAAARASECKRDEQAAEVTGK